ncbi:LTA synthase family protein [Hominisplanchenecus sp.]|uniref:LTA synthase family protein n=1 Tax=Hominisplanchenecus sp. TaxID=3038130 RepID=UPI00399302B2
MRFSGCFLCIFSIIFSLTNYFTTTFRGIPILALDPTIMGTAMNVVGNYKYSLDLTRTITLLGLITWCILLFRVKRLRLPKGKKRISTILGSAAICFASFWIMIYTPVMTVTPMHVTVNTFRPIKSYRKNGCVLTFMRSIQLMIIHKPDGYSANAAEEIAAPYRSETSSGNAKTPNVIAIMDEAFADLQAVGDFRTSEDVMPFYHSLTKNTVKGFSYVSVFGGQTANTEFEFLTGLSKAFVPASATPYQLYIKSLLPGLTTHLGNQDYQGMLAFHPFRANGYNRDHVYPNLGFSDFISLKDLDVSASDKIRNFVSDAADFQVIIDQYEQAKKKSNAPFYLFNVTMQNHSGYDQDFDNLDMPISIEEKCDDPELKRYLNLIHHSDTALKSLIEYFSKQKDPTVIVFFGDHEPGLSNEVYSKILGKNVEKLSAEENMNLYKTPFLIWANYDIEEQENVNISMNYLSTLMLESTGMKLSPFNQFLLDIHKQIPVLTTNGYFGEDGSYYSLKDESSPYYESLRKYQILQYNDLFDKKKRIENFFD